MDQITHDKVRPMVVGQVVATATPTAYPTWPLGPTDRVTKYAGDFRNARIAGAAWTMADLTTFTAADGKLQSSADGVTWHDVKGFTQKSANGTEVIWILDTDPKILRFLRLLVTMTGTPGTSTHTLNVYYSQHGPVGELADGVFDRAN